MIHPLFRNISRLFALLFKNGNNNPTRDSFDKYYLPLVKIKYFNVLIDNKQFFDQPVQNTHEKHEKLFEMARNN